MRSFFFFLLPLVLFSMQGCGGGTTSGTFNPTSSTSASTTTDTSNSTTTTGYSVSVSASPTTIDANLGQVLVTAKVADSSGNALAGVQVTFGVVAGPGTVDTNLEKVYTDSNGEAMSIIVSGDTSTTTNVIYSAVATISGQQVSGLGTFQIVRGTGVISFPGAPYSAEKTIDATSTGGIFFQQVAFKVTDANGNPRPGVPVTLSVYSHSSNSSVPSIVTIDYLQTPITESDQMTVTTDSQGMGIFNVTVQVYAPGPGNNTVDSIVFKAVTSDTNQLVGYAGLMTNLTQTAPTGSASLSISPQTASFLAADVAGATRSFGISGGTVSTGYLVSSSNPNLVTVALQPGGTTAVATLVDDSLWTGSVSIIVTDQAGTTTSATITRQ